MALNVDLNPGDELVFPSDCAARVRVVAKNGRRTRLAIESERRVRVLRATPSAPPAQKQPLIRGTTNG